ncbi:hypothetical protein Q73A0000_09525 [Kaistella flava (ex Peng et al. 2021)]|uniref:DUF2971 domain-containing protein n=1 Tax=Kaistella flava (ex Peng et al. 2021) TaxID=2038776 RepID=A0A7M2YAD0_9FLAO|nr:hypothetical protein [Kaistella flava (ex Peng et al. 2021)]QOW10595.1 hypothetical protein Q73A0000_09525 [Kaistella flava (ex Peng et al. 2021)]
MPINFSSEANKYLYLPNNNQQIARYIDLSKFLSLIQSKTIFFNKLSNFEDKYEGTLTPLSLDDLENAIRSCKSTNSYLLSNPSIDTENYYKKRIIAEKKMYKLSRETVYVSCWNKIENESYALWKIYAGLNQGIMIKSNVERIIQAFAGADEDIEISEVKYIDFKKEKINIGNIYHPLVHKNIPYSYEDEIRLLFQPFNNQNGEIPNLEKVCEDHRLIGGKSIKIDINLLIEEIIVSPFAPYWFFEIVKNIVDKYDLKINVQYSEFV